MPLLDRGRDRCVARGLILLESDSGLFIRVHSCPFVVLHSHP